jgi:putative PIN family toxin of toxin-antitoxin system
MKIVLDTNVLISALVFPGSKPDKILDRVRQGEIELVLSPFILSEFARVLRDKFGFSKRETDDSVGAVSVIACLITPNEQISVIAAKEDDNRILECAVAAQADFLVTGDKQHLLPVGTYRGVQIVAPAQLLDLLEQR